MSNVPKLRFKEFGGDWEEKKLGEISSIKTGNKDTQNKVSDGLYPFFVRSNTIERINSYSFDGEAILTAGDGVGVGKVFHYLNEKFDYHQRVYNIHNFHKDISGKYIFFYFSDKFNKRIMKLSAKNSVDSVRMEMISNMEIPLPSKQEQEKIASFLTSVDTKIEQLTKKEALLKEYKKGLMNKIFNQEIRFKDDDGSEFPEWEEKTLNELVTFKNGKAHENDIVDNGKYIVVNSKFISSDGQKAKYSDSQITPLFKNDIVMVMSDVPNGKALAKCFFIEEDDKYSLNQRICALKQTSNNNKFLIYLINRNKYYLSFDSGVGQTNLKRNEVLDLILNMPCIQEQTKIANFLSSIDNKIEQTTKQLNQTKEFKKALLQTMFV